MRILRLALAVGMAVSSTRGGRASAEADIFGQEPAALLAAAAAVKGADGADDVVLFSEKRYTFDEAGRCETRSRYVTSVRTVAGRERTANRQVSWAPWFENKPSLRARVILPDGSVRKLDSTTITEGPASESDPDLFSDRRMTRAPLPAVAPGAVVEEEVTLTERAPLLDAGVVKTVRFPINRISEMTRLVIDFPESLSVRTRVLGPLPLVPVRQASQGRVVLTFERGRNDSSESWELGLPSDETTVPTIVFGTGNSWRGVAARYHQIVEEQIGEDAAARKIVAEVSATAKGRSELIQKLLARVQAIVRYTGVELSEASIVPRSPDETLRRRFGDCKDKAALLVSLLRRAGIPAAVALLQTGPGLDVVEEIPGFGAFDHAIVQIPGDPVLWVDATAEYSRVGEIPLAVRGRRALVAAPETIGLVAIPASESAANVSRETREFQLSESGPARVIEIRGGSGEVESEERASYALSTAKARKESAERRAREVYLAKGAVTSEATDPHDLSKPFSTRLEAQEAGRGVTTDSEALVALHPFSLLERLPSSVLGSGDTGAGSPTKAEAEKLRKREFVFFEPYISELNYRIVPPPGFEPEALPDRFERRLGESLLTQEFRVADDRSILATLRFDSGPQRINASRYEELKAGVAQIRKLPVTLLRFRQKGMHLLEEGKIGEALAEFRASSAAEPTRGVPASRVALALLRGGLGTAARQQARAAVQLNVKSAFAQKMLGWVYQHDLFGRRFFPGWDRAGSVAAYRQARDADSKDAAIRIDLAVVLEYDPEGRRYGTRSDLSAAIDEYRALQKDLQEHRADTNLLIDLMYARRFEDLVATASALEPSDTTARFLVLAAAVRQGGEAALDEARRRFVDTAKRREALEGIASTLANLRLYSSAAALLDAATSGAENPSALRARADAFQRVKVFDSSTVNPGDPKSVVCQFLGAVLGASDRGVESFLASRVPAWEKEYGSETGETVRVAEAMRALRRTALPSGVPPDAILDIAVSLSQFVIDGDEASGYRVRLKAAIGGNTVNEVLYLVRDGTLRVLSVGRLPGLLGLEALRRLDAGDLVAARTWLDWAREEIPKAEGDDPVGGHPFPHLWTRGTKASAAEIRRAAAVLAAIGASTPGVVHALQAALASDDKDDSVRPHVERALASALMQRSRWSDLDRVARALRQRFPDSITALNLSEAAFIELGELDEGRRIAEDRLRRLPDDPPALRILANLNQYAGRFVEAAGCHQILVKKGEAEAIDYNNIAWFALFTGEDLTRAIENAQRAVDLSRSQDAVFLHTLATLYAEAGRNVEARDTLLKSLSAAHREEPAPHDWYVLGRLAENYGERDAARESYRRAAETRGREDRRGSTRELAMRRLAKMEGRSADATSRTDASATRR